MSSAVFVNKLADEMTLRRGFSRPLTTANKLHEMLNPCKSRKGQPEDEVTKFKAPIKFPQDPSQAKKWAYELSQQQGKDHYKYECNYDERHRRAEEKRMRLLEQLKFEYRINVEELSNDVVEGMLKEMEAMEKQRQLREKEKIECRLKFIAKLLNEEKAKRKGQRVRPKRREQVKARETDVIISTPEEESWLGEREEDYLLPPAESFTEEAVGEGTTPEEEEEDSDADDKFDKKLPGLDPDFVKLLRQINNAGRMITPPGQAVQTAETHLESTPGTIVFENCKPNTVHSQTYRVANIGRELIHCRYLGIEMKNDDADASLPFRAAVMDNVLLYPGLSFSSKVRFFCLDETTEVSCCLVFETRRKKNPTTHSYFRIPLLYFPARAIIEVLNTTLRFQPAQCDEEKGMRKSLRIKNSGAKQCWCRIAKQADELSVRGESKETGSTNECDLDSEEVAGEDDTMKVEVSESSFEYPGESQVDLRGLQEAEAVMEELIDNVFETFRFSRKYWIPIPEMETTRVDVEFFPEYKGYHHQVCYVVFEDASNCHQEKIELIGDVKKTPLRIEPAVVDLKICVTGSGVYEGIFTIFSESNGSLPVRVKVPGSMKNHSMVFPRSPVIQPKSSQICSVRLFPGLNIGRDAYRYYKEDTKVLEFPVFVQLVGSNFCKSEVVKVYVFALLTDYSLELKPEEINFGDVTTQETIRTVITLTNHSMATQEYGFLNLPMGVRIEPNYGFGKILPKETVDLYLLYSPVIDLSVKNVPDDEGIYNFKVSVVSIAEVGGFREKVQPPADTESEISDWEEDFIHNTEVESSVADEMSLLLETREAEEGELCDEEESLIDPAEELRLLEEKQEKIREYLNREQGTVRGEDSQEQVEIVDYPEVQGEVGGEYSVYSVSGRKNMNVIFCRAMITNNQYELSATVVQLPATPLSSFSMTRIRLNGTSNHPTGRCSCNYGGKLRKRREDGFQAIFECDVASKLLTTEPQTGTVSQGESIPIMLIFRPEFTNRELMFQSRILKAEAMLEEEYKSKEPRSSKSKTIKTGRQGSRAQKVEPETQDINLKALDINTNDLFSGERALQQLMDPFYLVINVACIVKVLPLGEIPEKAERHTIIVIAPVVKPNFTYLGDCQEIKFGKVALGDRRRKILQIQNNILKRISPKVTALNPHGPFICTTGWKMDKVDPEHIRKYPITFAPFEGRGQENEFFDIFNGATRLSLTVNGEGVVPKLGMTPEFSVCLIELGNEELSETEFSIENQCEAEMRIKFVREYVKETEILEENSPICQITSSSRSEALIRKGEKKNGRTTTMDVRKRVSFAAQLSPESFQELQERFVDVENAPDDLFTIIGLDSNDEIDLQPTNRATLKIKFVIHKDDSSLTRGDSTGFCTGAYVALYKLILGSSATLKELTIIGIFTKPCPLEENSRNPVSNPTF